MKDAFAEFIQHLADIEKKVTEEYMFNELARQLAKLRDSFIEVGFTDEQAFKLVLTLLEGGLK